MRRILTALALSSALAAGTAQAAGPGAGDIALFYTDVTSSNSTIVATGGGATAAALQPTYNVGFFVTDDVMPFVGIHTQTIDDTDALIRGGARFYGIPGDTGNLRTFVAGELTLLSATTDATGLGAFFGAEYNVAPQFGISGRVGLRWVDPDTGDSITRLGATDLSLNFYF